MSIDSENLERSNDYGPDDIASLFLSIGMKNIKIALFLAILFVFISSDVFIQKILSSSSVDGRYPNTKGVFVQSIILAMGYLLLDIIVRYDYL